MLAPSLPRPCQPRQLATAGERSFCDGGCDGTDLLFGMRRPVPIAPRRCGSTQVYINGVLPPQISSSGMTAPGQLYINAGGSPTETSNFGVLEYIGWTRALSSIDLYEMSQYLARPSSLLALAAHAGVPRRKDFTLGTMSYELRGKILSPHRTCALLPAPRRAPHSCSEPPCARGASLQETRRAAS